MFAIGGAAMAAPPNDECATPTPISGDGSWNLDDLLTATLSANPSPIGIGNKDVWYCWTPTWSGVASLDMSGNPVFRAEVYAGCGCPAVGSAPIATLFGPVQAATFPVVCGERYLIRIGAEEFPTTIGNVRSFKIDKVSGKDCPLPAGGTCNDCCGGKPTYNDPLYTSNFTGQVAVESFSFVGQFSTGGPLITIYNLAATPAPVPGASWNPVPGTAPTAFRYTKPNWDINTLGSIFCLTLDNGGNIYTAYCAAINAPRASSLAGSTSGSIFKIPTGTGNPQVFCNIPDNLAPPVTCNGSIIFCQTPLPCAPGIGDVCSDCAHSNQFFASAFADGRVYRISSAGVILEAYDHATDLVSPPGREIGNLYDRYVPLGERVWAVKVHNGRLYYSVWGQDLGCSSPPAFAPNSAPNRVWSIGLTSGGAFIPGSRRLELQVPAYPRTPRPSIGDIFDPQVSEPISDISFSDDCRMLLAERDMGGNGVLVGAHVARGLEYAWNGTAWVPTFNRGGYGMPLGGAPVGLPNTNAAGGCDYDNSTGGTAADRVWFSCDFATGSPLTYGLTGLDRTAPALATAVHIDYAGLNSQEKTKLCDVEIPCVVEPCAAVVNGRLLCNPGSPGQFTWTFQVTNNTNPPTPIQYILLPGPNFTQNIITLPSVLLPGQTSAPITTVLTGLLEGQPFCFNMTFADPSVAVCCRIQHCLDVPLCECLQLPLLDPRCIPGTPGAFTLNFTVQNLSPVLVNELFLFPPLGSGVTITPNYFPLTPPLPYGGTSTPQSVTISGATPGQQLCIRFSIHRNGEECCSKEICFTVPAPCAPVTGPTPCTPGALCYADCDGNGLVNIQDYACFLNNFASGNSCANCDMSTMAPVLNVQDFSCFLNAFAAGCSG